MQPFPVSILPASARIRTRTALVASADRSFRQRLNEILTGLRWQVREAEGGAQAWAEAVASSPEAMIVDSWLPDLDLAEFLGDFRTNFPDVDLVTASGSSTHESPRGPFRQELLYALRRSQDTDTAVWNTAPVLSYMEASTDQLPESSLTSSTASIPIPTLPILPAGLLNAVHAATVHSAAAQESASSQSSISQTSVPQSITAPSSNPVAPASEPSMEAAPAAVNPFQSSPMQNNPPLGNDAVVCERLPELVGNARCMLEVSRRIRLVAPRSTPVLIEGPTGSGKELVAEALHRLSPRCRKPFVAINCAAIPEALLEAELFGHTRGAFTGAVQGRVGRIESADGGTLFLDEIGEMPLSLQSKLLRFVECGELQRVGDNETVKVDVRILAATHQALAKQTQTGAFRSDLYYRLAVFLIRTPALTEHMQDLPLLVEHFLQQMGRSAPVKRIDASALAQLTFHAWPGNVRELEHVLERAAILAGDQSVLTVREIDFGQSVN